MSMEWPQDKLNRLRSLAAAPDRWSAAEIAFKLNTSRNAVIGKIKRLKIPWTSTGKTHVEHALLRPKPPRTLQNPKPRKPKAYLGSDALYAGVGMGMALEETRNSYGECRWPIGHLHCCGKPSGERPYCVEHSRVAYQGMRWSKPVAAEMPRVERVG